MLSSQLKISNKWVINNTKGNPDYIKTGYYVANGIPGDTIVNRSNLAFIAPFLFSALISGNKDWSNSLWRHIT